MKYIIFRCNHCHTAVAEEDQICYHCGNQMFTKEVEEITDEPNKDTKETNSEYH